VPCSKACSEVL